MKLWTTLLAAFCLLFPSVAVADNYPSHPIKVIVPFAAGGSTDVIMRTLAPYLEKELGQKIGIVNIEGASGSAGAMQVLQAQPDGYTLLCGQTSMLTAYHMNVGKFTWDALTPICNLADFDLILTVKTDAPWKSVEDLIADAKKRPDQIMFGVNMGAGAHFAGVALGLASGAQFHFVAAGGDAKRTTALLGGHVDVTHPGAGAIIQYVETGKLRPLASFGEKRTPGLEQVPTLAELGYDASVPFYNGLFGPADLPDEIVAKINAAAKKAVANPEFVKVLNNAAMYTDYMDQKTYIDKLLKLDADLYRFARAGRLIPSRIPK